MQMNLSALAGWCFQFPFTSLCSIGIKGNCFCFNYVICHTFSASTTIRLITRSQVIEWYIFWLCIMVFKSENKIKDRANILVSYTYCDCVLCVGGATMGPLYKNECGDPGREKHWRPVAPPPISAQKHTPGLHAGSGRPKILSKLTRTL